MIQKTPVIELFDAEIARDSKKILNHVNLQVLRGEFVYLIGRVGSGKSSLMKTLYAELPLTTGEGTVVGFNLRKLSNNNIPLLRRKLGIVFQDFQLLTDRSVYNNLQFVLKATGWTEKSDINARINQVLDYVELPQKKHKMPHELSGGEQQRIVIARALLNDPELILADEPTGNLDPESSDTIMKILIMLVKNGRTVVMATHNYAIINRYSGVVVKCENGTCMHIGAWELQGEI